MAKKLIIDGNYLLIEDTVSGQIFEGLRKNVFIRSYTTEGDRIYIEGIHGWSGSKPILVSDIIDQDDNALTLSQLRSVYRNHTGNIDFESSGPGAQHSDPRFIQAIRQIKSDYGDDIDIINKAKKLDKYGRYDNLGSTLSMIWLRGGFENELTTNGITHISSSDAGDDQMVRIEGHTKDGSGNKTFVVQTVALNGQNKVALTTPLGTSTRIENDDSTPLNGTVYVYEDTTILTGMPIDTSKIHLQTDGNNNRSLKCATSMSENDYWLIDALTFSVNRQQSRNVDFYFQTKELGKVWKTEMQPIAVSSQTGSFHWKLPSIYIGKPNMDFRMSGISSGSGTGVSATMHGILASKI